MAKPIAPNPANAIGTVVASLGIVLGLFLMLVWCSRRFAPAGTALLPKEALELLGRAALVGKHQAQLVRVGNKLLVVALSPAGATTLTEITEPAEIERLTAICRGGKPGSSTAAFRQVLDQMAQEPASGGFVGVATSNRRGGR
jgi:flagellar biogenesis protein FliO